MSESRILLDRAGGMAVMARASRLQLAKLWQNLRGDVRPVLLRAPETGMVRLTTQAGQSGPRFQFGEASVTRCVVSWEALHGYAVHLGSDAPKAEYAAYLDILMQQGCLKTEAALNALAAEQAEQKLEKARRAEATKVRFYTTKVSS